MAPPTGYTSDIYKGKKKVTFEHFALQCARAFGALITMRDDPSDAPIPKRFVPDSHYADKVEDCLKERNAAEDMTIKQAAKKAKRQHIMEQAADTHLIRKAEDLRARYEDMLILVRAWIPPTKDHEGLKDFMIQQLDESIRFDCDTSYREKKLAASVASEPLTGAEYKDIRVRETQRDLNYYREEKLKEEARCKERNEWVDALRKSL